jgi:hypothetical protein
VNGSEGVPHRDTIRARLQRYVKDAIELAGGPKAVALALRRRGFTGRGQLAEGTVRNWRGWNMPPADVLVALAVMSGISLDEYLRGQRFEDYLSEVVANHEARLGVLEALFSELADEVGVNVERPRIRSVALARILERSQEMSREVSA